MKATDEIREAAAMALLFPAALALALWAWARIALDRAWQLEIALEEGGEDCPEARRLTA
jgi:hypothetical protein